MNFLADESVDQGIVIRLRTVGHSVLAVSEMEPGLTDDAVLAAANEQGALLLTADKDFGELVFRQGRLSSGVVLIRLAGLTLESKCAAVTNAVNEHGEELSGAFTVLSPGIVRIRKRS